MKKHYHLLFFTLVALLLSSLYTSCKRQEKVKDTQVNVSDPEIALQEMKAGNARFLSGHLRNINYLEDIQDTKEQQHPHTLVLSCLDSRVPPEIIFDQGIGRIFVARDAGNIEALNILGSIEFAVKYKHTKLIIVMGHSNCGAVKGALDDIKYGNLTYTINQIKPAIVVDTTHTKDIANETSKANVRHTIQDILDKSFVISSRVAKGYIKIIGAFYDVATGKVLFMEEGHVPDSHN